MKRNLTTLLIAMCSIFMMSAKAQDTASFKPSGNLWGYVFGDYYYKTHSDSLGRGAGNVQYRGVTPSSSTPNPNGQMDAFQIRRAYLGYDYNIAPQYTVYAVLADEAGPNITGFPGTDLDAGGSNTVYLKYMYLKWSNVFKGSNLLIGQMPTPSFATPFGTEPLWSYRSIERTIMDMHNNDASSEMGVSLQGNLWTKKSDSDKPTFIGYQLQVGNGASAKPESDRFKKYRGTVYVSAMQQKLTVGVYGDDNTTQLSPYHITTTTMKGYVHYKTDCFRIGVEVFQQTNKNGDISKDTAIVGAKADTTDGIQMGVSAFLSGRIIKNKLNYFLRWDMYNPDTKFSSTNKYTASATGGNLTSTTFYTQTFYTVGLDWTPNSRVHIMPNLWYNQYNTMSGLTNSNGSAMTGRVKTDQDVVVRLSFYFLFNGSKKVSNNGMDY